MGLVAFTAAQLRGVESKYLNFPDEGHFVLKLENSLHWHSVVIVWINRHTGKEKQV
jgi:dipeptidyl aminopeptidase/acylaminoacyl peptidase